MTKGFPFQTVIFDVDGTLIDSNDAHARAWTEALHEDGIEVETLTVRRMIGMGGDKLLPSVSGLAAESARGKAIGRRKKEIFSRLLPELHQTAGARALLEYLRERHVTLAIATSAGADELSQLLARAGLEDLFDRKASSDDAEESKPDPDIVIAALMKADATPETTVLVGDTPYDVEAAGRAGIASIALRCGGFWPDAALAGAIAILDHPAALLEWWQREATGKLLDARGRAAM
jgi:HAD superfamily hydrolase (TIGR01509 family)